MGFQECQTESELKKLVEKKPNFVAWRKSQRVDQKLCRASAGLLRRFRAQWTDAHRSGRASTFPSSGTSQLEAPGGIANQLRSTSRCA